MGAGKGQREGGGEGGEGKGEKEGAEGSRCFISREYIRSIPREISMRGHVEIRITVSFYPPLPSLRETLHSVGTGSVNC